MTKRIPARPGRQSDDALNGRVNSIGAHYAAMRRGGVVAQDAFASALYADRVKYRGREGAASWAAEQSARTFAAVAKPVFGKKGQ